MLSVSGDFSVRRFSTFNRRHLALRRHPANAKRETRAIGKKCGHSVEVGKCVRASFGAAGFETDGLKPGPHQLAREITRQYQPAERLQSKGCISGCRLCPYIAHGPGDHVLQTYLQFTALHLERHFQFDAPFAVLQQRECKGEPQTVTRAPCFRFQALYEYLIVEPDRITYDTLRIKRQAPALYFGTKITPIWCNSKW